MPKHNHSPKRNRQQRQDLSGLPDPTGLPAPIPAELPEGWQMVRLGDVIQPRRNLTQPSADGKARYVGLEHIDSGNVRLSRWGIESEVKSSKSKFFAGDVLYGKLRPYLDKAALAEWEGMCATDILVFVTDKRRAIPEFVAYLLHTRAFLGHAISTTSGTNHPRTSWQALQMFTFPLPPLPEQRAIARVLSTIQRAIETQDKLIAAARALKRALMRHLFTYGAVPPAQAERVPLKETEIGAVPEWWEIEKLENLACLITKGASPKWQGFNYVTNGIVFVRSQNVDWGKINLSDVAYLPATFNQKEKKSIIASGDVLINLVGASIGRVAVAPNEIAGGNLNQAVAIVRLRKDQCDPQFLSSYLLSEGGQRQILGHVKAVARANVSLQDVRSLRVPLLPLSEQRAIARILSAVDRKIAAEEKRKAALQTLFKTMLHKLMTGQIRVK